MTAAVDFRKLQHADAVARPFCNERQISEFEKLAVQKDVDGTLLTWGKKDGQEWRHQIGRLLDGLSKVPYVGNSISNHYLKLCKAKSEREANLFFLDLRRRLRLGGYGYATFWLLSDDMALENFIELRLKEIGRLSHLDLFTRFHQVTAICGRYFEPHPAISENELKQLDSRHDCYMPSALFKGIGPALARMTDANWWFKRISTIQTQTLEQVCRETVAVCKRRAVYCSDFAFDRIQEQNLKNRELLDALLAVDSDDQENYFSLLEMAQKTVSNPEIRRAELMTRIRGFEEVANENGDVGVFITVTCPSRFHSATRHGQPNKKFDGSTPKDAQKWLTERWAKCRALNSHYELMPYGFRIAEPHHDGCPHWHMLMFVPAEKVGVFQHSLRNAFLKDEIEAGSMEHRLTVKIIDPNKGTAAGYIAKYVAKNVDGTYLSKDRSSKLNGKDAAARVRAWASVWGIRQFQSLGGPSVSIWREMRRFNESFEATHPMVAQLNELERHALERVRKAADEGDWSAFCKAMGGVHVRRADRTIQLSYKIPEIINKVTGELGQTRTRYGDVAKTKVVGVVFKHVFLATRFTDWEVVDKKRFIEATGQIMGGVSDVFDLMDQYEMYVQQMEADYEHMEALLHENPEQHWFEIDEHDAAEFLILGGD